jgi:plastocyanin
MIEETEDLVQSPENLTSQEETNDAGSYSRPSFSALKRVALVAALLGTLAGIGGTVTLALNGSADLTPIIVATVFWLLSLVTILTRFRWSPILTTITSACILFILFTQPFATASLANPKDTQSGGLGHFIGNVVLLAMALLVFGASLGQAIDNYRPAGRRKVARLLPLGLALIIGLMIGAIFIGILAQPQVASNTTTYTNGVPTVHMNTANFAQSSVTIPKGSKLLLVDDTSVPHLLFNGSWQNGSQVKQAEPGAPSLTGDMVNGNSTITIGPFTVAGTYHIYCSLHQGMNLTIIVQ